MSEPSIVKPFIQTHKTCDNNACVNWHGQTSANGEPKLYAKTDLPKEIDAKEGTQFPIGPRMMTVCNTCSHCIDIFFHLYKYSQHKTTPPPIP